MPIGNCKICDSYGVLEGHHVITRKQQPALKQCEINIINICESCHRGTYGFHGKYPEEVTGKTKLEFQDKLLDIFHEESYEIEEIREKLAIKYKDAMMLCKSIYPIRGKYPRMDIIRACMGGRIY